MHIHRFAPGNSIEEDTHIAIVCNAYDVHATESRDQDRLCACIVVVDFVDDGKTVSISRANDATHRITRDNSLAPKDFLLIIPRDKEKTDRADDKNQRQEH